MTELTDLLKFRESLAENLSKTIKRLPHGNYIPAIIELMDVEKSIKTLIDASQLSDEDVIKLSKKRVKRVFQVPTLQQCRDFFVENGQSDKLADRFYTNYSCASPPWTDANGKPVRSWQQKARVVWFVETGETKQHPYSEQQLNEIRRRLNLDGSYPDWFDKKYQSILNYQTLVAEHARRS
jgi:hypothetical protein